MFLGHNIDATLMDARNEANEENLLNTLAEQDV